MCPRYGCHWTSEFINVKIVKIVKIVKKEKGERLIDCDKKIKTGVNLFLFFILFYFVNFYFSFILLYQH
jgi:hypothetical protein